VRNEREAEVLRRLRLPYHRVIFGEPDEGYMGQVAELPGCYTSGDTPVEALSNVEEAMAGWIESCLISGDPIPDPARALAPVA
jgi:predicted RNase H-like HicB family nuclease